MDGVRTLNAGHGSQCTGAAALSSFGAVVFAGLPNSKTNLQHPAPLSLPHPGWQRGSIHPICDMLARMSARVQRVTNNCGVKLESPVGGFWFTPQVR